MVIGLHLHRCRLDLFRDGELSGFPNCFTRGRVRRSRMLWPLSFSINGEPLAVPFTSPHLSRARPIRSFKERQRQVERLAQKSWDSGAHLHSAATVCRSRLAEGRRSDVPVAASPEPARQPQPPT